DDLLIEFAKIKAREVGRSLVPCRTCGERNKIPLAGYARCYACRVHPIEGDHVAGSGSGPAVIRGSANVNRITAEGERVLECVMRPGLCDGCRLGFPLRVGVFLGRLEVDL